MAGRSLGRGWGLGRRPDPLSWLAHSLARSLAHFVFANCPPETRRAPGGAGPRPAHFVPARAGCGALTPRSHDTPPPARAPAAQSCLGNRWGLQGGTVAGVGGAAGGRTGLGGLERLLSPALPQESGPRPLPAWPRGMGCKRARPLRPPPRVRQRILPGPHFLELGRDVVN